MTFVVAAVTNNKNQLQSRLAEFAPVESAVQVYDETLSRDILRSSSKFGSTDIVVARYELNESLIDARLTLLIPRVWDDNPAREFTFFATSLHLIDTYLRPLYDENQINCLGADGRTRVVNGQTVSCLEVPNPKRPWDYFTASEKGQVAAFTGYIKDDNGNDTTDLALQVVAL